MRVMQNNDGFQEELKSLVDAAARLAMIEVVALFPLAKLHPFYNGTKGEMNTDRGSDSALELWQKIVSFANQNELEMVIYPDQNFFELPSGVLNNDLFYYKKIGFRLKP